MTSTRNIFNIQQDFALSCGIQSKIIWDSLAADQSDILKQKIETLLPNVDENQNVLKQRQLVFENVWRQRIYSNGNLLSAIVYVMVTKDAIESPENAKEAIKFTCHPVIRIRKCINYERTSTGCCMIFVDEHSRIYQNWNEYLERNILPHGIMVAPKNGVYTFDENDEVELIYQKTPASSEKNKSLKQADIAVSVIGMCLAAPLMLPLAPVTAIGLTAASIPLGTYSLIRSAMQLLDRRTHGQTISLRDSTARNSWLGAVGGAVGLGAVGASSALSLAAINGNRISTVAKVAVNGINASSILFSSAGMVNGVYDIYVKMNDEKIDSMDILQLATSLITITHAINNLYIISKIPTGNTAVSVRRTLTKYMQQLNNRLTGQSMTTRDIIRIANNIPIRETLYTLHNVNTALEVISISSTMLTDIKECFESDDPERLNFKTLIKRFGGKFVQHIVNENSFADIILTMARYFTNDVFDWLMQFAGEFIATTAEIIDSFLNAKISTEEILYRLLMQCIERYKVFNVEFLESKTAEIRKDIETYFTSLNPINVGNIKYDCKVCKGCFYTCTLK